MNEVPGYVRPGGKSYVSPEGLIYCTDGKLRWVHEFDQRKCPTVLLDFLWKYVALALVVGALFLHLLPRAGGWAVAGTWAALIGAAVVVALARFGLRLLENGRFVCLVYTLDEQSISCQRIKGKTDKAYVTHAFAVWVGGQSQPAVRVSDMKQARLDRVRALVCVPGDNRIRLRGAKGLGTVFVEPQQLQPVLDRLKQSCPGANVK